MDVYGFLVPVKNNMVICMRKHSLHYADGVIFIIKFPLYVFNIT